MGGISKEGVAVRSSVLRSAHAVQVNIEIMRTFVRLRRMVASNTALARRLHELEKKYDVQFKTVFDTIRQLLVLSEYVLRSLGASPNQGYPAIHTLRSDCGVQSAVQPERERPNVRRRYGRCVATH